MGSAVTDDCAALTAAGCTNTAELCVMATPFAVAETVFGSAFVELIEPVAKPAIVVVAAGCVMVLFVPFDEMTTVAPEIRLLN